MTNPLDADVESDPTLLAFELMPDDAEADRAPTLLFVDDSPVDSEPTELVAEDSPLESEVTPL